MALALQVFWYLAGYSNRMYVEFQDFAVIV